MPAQVIVKLVADPSGLQPGIESLEQLQQIDKETADQFKASNKSFQDRNKTIGDGVTATGKLSTASKNLIQSITGGAISQVSLNIDKLNGKMLDGAKDTDIYTKSIKTAQEQLAKLKPDSAEYTALSNEIKAATKSFNDLATGTKNPIERLREIETTMAALASEGLQDTEVFKGLQQQATDLGNAIDNGSQRFKDLSKNAQDAKQRLNGFQEGTKEFNQLQAEIAASELAMANFAEEATSSRGQLRQFRETLLQLEDAGLDGTQVFEDLANAAGELEDQVGDTQARIHVLASDTFKFDVAIQAIQGVTAAFGIAQGAAALFGDENEDLQKTLLKVNAAMAILNGLQQIQQILQKESALNIGASVALQRLQVVQTDLQAAAESRFIVVRYAAAVAQRVLNAVMAANPAGVVLLAIAALATAVYAFTKASDEATKAQKKLNDQLQISIDLTDAFVKSIGDAGTERLAQLKNQNATESQLGEARIATLESQLNEQKKATEKANANYASTNEAFIKLGKDASKEDADNRQKAYDLANTANEKQNDIQHQLDLERLNQQKVVQDESLKNTVAFADARVKAAQKGSGAELNAQIAAIKTKADAELKSEALTEGERVLINNDADRQILELRQQFQNQLLTDKAAALQAEAALTNDAAKKAELERQAIVLKAQADSIGKTGEQQKAIELQRQADLKQLDESTKRDLLNNQANYLQAEADLTIDAVKKLEFQKAALQTKLEADLIGKTTDEQKVIAQQAQVQLKQIDDEGTRAILQNRKNLYDAAAVNEKNNAVADELSKQSIIVQAQIDSVGKSAAEQLLIEKKKQKDIEDIEIAATNRRRQLALSDIKAREIVERDTIKNLEIQKQEVIAQAEIDEAGKTADEILQIEKDKNNSLLALDKQIADERKAQRARLAETELNLASTLAGSLGQIAQDQSDYQLSLLQNQLDKGLISQQEYDTKTKQIKVRAAQEEKELALFQATIAQSLAVLAVLKDQTIPIAAKPIFIGFAIASAIAQIAAIASKPIPAFKKGTKFKPTDGPALIGEAGAELFHANGQWGYAAGPTILDLPRGSKVIPSLETDKILKKYDLPITSMPAHLDVSPHRNVIDYKKLGVIIGGEIAKLPLQVFGYDKNGPWQHTTSMQQRRNYLNKRYGIK